MNSICVTIAFFALHSFCSLVSSQIFCSDLLAPKKLKFYPVRHCQRSNKTRIAAKTVGNLEKCAQFAEHNQGLAFNFGHGQKPRKMSDQENLINLFETIREKNATYTFKIKKELELANDPYFNCEVLDCPETGNMSTIVNDTRYDYYSLYGYGETNNLIDSISSTYTENLIFSTGKCHMPTNDWIICFLLRGTKELYIRCGHM